VAFGTYDADQFALVIARSGECIIRLGAATKQSRLSSESLVWIASSLRSLAMTSAPFQHRAETMSVIRSGTRGGADL
jgi:hypothetical protein